MSDNNISIIAGNTTLIKTNKQNRKHVKEIWELKIISINSDI
jgi:hypothetical protein